ncbi:hypothetical protein [Leisingera aquimarina]|uniref:hypothetical protein n=1 Tax=Leisingera aquimarina TaxID=476529 RepID=UPI000486A367|nr:hypothetical protein [Leisingera aquimarina]
MTMRTSAGRPKSYNQNQVAKALKDLAGRGIEPSVEAVKRHLREEQHLQISPRPEALQIVIDDILAREAEERTLRLIEALPSEATSLLDHACDLVKRQLLLGLAEGYSELLKKNALPMRELRDLLNVARTERERSEQKSTKFARQLEASHEQNDKLYTLIEKLKAERNEFEKELIAVRAQLTVKDEVLSLLTKQ